MSKEESLINIAELHIDRLNYAYEKLKTIFPISGNKVYNLTQDEILLLDSFTSRFAKLQDLIGSQLLDIYLNNIDENSETLTRIDKINKLEKFGIINSKDWKEMRQIRNNISHEYPEQPELMASNLNKIYNLTPQLIDLLKSLKLIILKK